MTIRLDIYEEAGWNYFEAHYVLPGRAGVFGGAEHLRVALCTLHLSSTAKITDGEVERRGMPFCEECTARAALAVRA